MKKLLSDIYSYQRPGIRKKKQRKILEICGEAEKHHAAPTCL